MDEVFFHNFLNWFELNKETKCVKLFLDYSTIRNDYLLIRPSLKDIRIIHDLSMHANWEVLDKEFFYSCIDDNSQIDLSKFEKQDCSYILRLGSDIGIIINAFKVISYVNALMNISSDPAFNLLLGLYLKENIDFNFNYLKQYIDLEKNNGEKKIINKQFGKMKNEIKKYVLNIIGIFLFIISILLLVKRIIY
jgi:hypothetical protein